MTPTEVRLKYQQETGLGFDTILNEVLNPTICTEDASEIELLLDYIRWLEEQLCKERQMIGRIIL